MPRGGQLCIFFIYLFNQDGSPNDNYPFLFFLFFFPIFPTSTVIFSDNYCASFPITSRNQRGDRLTVPQWRVQACTCPSLMQFRPHKQFFFIINGNYFVYDLILCFKVCIIFFIKSCFAFVMLIEILIEMNSVKIILCFNEFMLISRSCFFSQSGSLKKIVCQVFKIFVDNRMKKIYILLCRFRN